MGVVLILPKVAPGDGSCPFAGGRAHCLSRQGRCPEGGDAPTVGAAFAFSGTPGELPRRGERPNGLVRTVVAHRGMSAGPPCRPALRRMVPQAPLAKPGTAFCHEIADFALEASHLCNS